MLQPATHRILQPIGTAQAARKAGSAALIPNARERAGNRLNKHICHFYVSICNAADTLS